MEIPTGTGFHEGERWTPEHGLEFLLTRTITDAGAQLRVEIDRYLGWPGQAPSYKVGERLWLEGRDAARAREGDTFDFKDFHTKALQFGGMGLEPLLGLLGNDLSFDAHSTHGMRTRSAFVVRYVSVGGSGGR